MQIFFATGSTCPSHHVLTQFGPQPSVHGEAIGACWAAWQQVPIRQHIACTSSSSRSLETQQSHPAFTGGWGSSSRAPTRMMLLDLLWLSRLPEHALDKHKPPWTGSMPRYGVESAEFISGTNRDRQLRCSSGEGEPSNSPHTLLVATAASLVTTPAGANCWGDSRASQMVRKLPDGRLWLPLIHPGTAAATYCLTDWQVCNVPSLN